MIRKIEQVLWAVILMISLIACGGKKDEATPAESEPTAAQSSSIGPFGISFDANGNYQGSFDAEIADQAAGSVEFFFNAVEKTTFKVNSRSSKAFGCDQQNFKLSLWWKPSAELQNMTFVNDGASLTVEKGARGSLLVAFAEIEGCSRLQFSMSLTKIQTSSTVQFPSEFLGQWKKAETIFGMNQLFQLDLGLQADGKIRVNYLNDCGNGKESFIGSIVHSDGTKNPKRFTMRIDQVTKEFQGACGNVLALSQYHQGQFVSCLAEKNATYGNFQLACHLASQPERYPSDWYQSDVIWKKINASL